MQSSYLPINGSIIIFSWNEKKQDLVYVSFGLIISQQCSHVMDNLDIQKYTFINTIIHAVSLSQT